MKTISVCKNIKIVLSEFGFYTHISKRTCFQTDLELIRKIIYKEKCGTVTKREFNKYKRFFFVHCFLLFVIFNNKIHASVSFRTVLKVC